MAKNKRGRSYKMTPRRRAALAKAQAASARKRRRRAVVAGGLAAATLAVGAGVALHRGQHRGGKRKRPGTALVHVPGMGTDYSTPKKTTIPKGWGIAPLPKPKSAKTTNKTVFKTNSKGVTVRSTKSRLKYDSGRRREYWQAKPVGGGTRKPYTSTKRGLR